MDQSVGAGVYAGRIARTINSGFIAMMISVGHRTGLFDVMAALPPSTSTQVAGAAGLSERYVREWLAAMTVARIVDYDARTGTYFLPIEYAAVLARMAGPNNLAPAAQMLSLLAMNEDLVVAGFRSGGGVMPQAYERLRDLVAAEKRQRIDESYVDALLDLMPETRVRLEVGTTVLDAGCGDGALTIAMARMFPRSAFRGMDASREAIRNAWEKLEESGLCNVEFVTADIADLDERRAFELVLAMESIREQSYPRTALRNLAAALRRDGVLLMQEVDASSHLARNAEQPFAPMLYALSAMHAVPVAIADDGDALGIMWGRERAAQMLAEAGFREARFETLAVDPLTYYCVAVK
ncbi:MAG TPA: methyltransferase domain-containing protein [Thermoanaerobaculia bacterium]|nr:methyltransferase domain-containing protein [Thermoanaerobaculia bacterium]